MAEGRTEITRDLLSDRLSACYSGALHDTLRELGHTNCVLPSAIQPIDPTYKLAGQVFTMEGHLEPGLDGHETAAALDRVFGARSGRPRGPVPTA